MHQNVLCDGGVDRAFKHLLSIADVSNPQVPLTESPTMVVPLPQNSLRHSRSSLPWNPSDGPVLDTPGDEKLSFETS